MSVINTNITSLIGQQNLQESRNNLQTSLERLSSGLRINSAKDDAAGQAIANRFTAQINGLDQAQRNANDGISLAQTAEGGLDQVNDNLQRIRELTVQASNDTNSQEDLNSIQDEIDQRSSEIDRISEQTDFNGTAVLKDGIGSLSIQVGSEDGQQIDINLESVNRDSLGLSDFNVNNLKVNTPEDGTTITADDGTEFSFVSGAESTGDGDTSVSQDEVSFSGADGTSTLVTDGDGRFFAKDTSGAEAKFFEVSGFTGTVSTAGTDSATVTATVDADAEALDYVSDTAGFSPTQTPLASLDDALGDVDSLRSELGAVQNRFESAVTNLNTNETNLSAARSRIEDADYASEVANQTKNQILQQAGTSTLAQANQIPQNVLSLLG